MSTVKADNFTWKSGQSGGLSGTNVTGDQIVYGVVKSWVNYNGSTQVVNKSYNVSSVTRNSTGYYTVSFTNSLVHADYAVVGSTTGYGTSDLGPNFFTIANSGTAYLTPAVKTISAIGITTGYNGAVSNVLWYSGIFA
ncbi:hypothetical protein EB001_21450 [bacterium]|nr:hypothetical protein [bacterium]